MPLERKIITKIKQWFRKASYENNNITLEKYQTSIKLSIPIP